MTNTPIKALALSLAITAAATPAAAQDLPDKQEVVVEKEYEPVIREADRITLLPDFADTSRVQLNFRYDIKSSILYGQFAPRPIEAAKIAPEAAQPALERAYLRLGGGNYTSGIGQFRVGSTRNEEYTWAAGADFQGSAGRIGDKWGNAERAQLCDLRVGARGKRLFRRTALEADAQYRYRYGNYYGYADPADTLPSQIGDNAQRASKFEARARIFTFARDKNAPDVSGGLLFGHLQARDRVAEDNIDLQVHIGKEFNAQFLGVDINLHYLKAEGLREEVDGFRADFNPWLGLFGKTWRVQAGVNSTYDDDRQTYHFYPNVRLHYNIAAFFLVPYLEVTGDYQVNTFDKILSENYYIRPDLYVEPTNNRVAVSGGIRGQASSRLGFNISARYRKTDNQYFFVADTSTTNARQYTVEYDNLQSFGLQGELSWKQSDQVNLALRMRYDTYTLDSLPAPYHTPKTQIDLTARYRLRRGVTLSGDLFYRGPADYKAADGTLGTLPALVDLNVMAEYQLNKTVGFFLQGGNLLHRRQYMYDNYQLQRLNIKAGAKILF